MEASTSYPTVLRRLWSMLRSNWQCVFGMDSTRNWHEDHRPLLAVGAAPERMRRRTREAKAADARLSTPLRQRGRMSKQAVRRGTMKFAQPGNDCSPHVLRRALNKLRESDAAIQCIHKPKLCDICRSEVGCWTGGLVTGPGAASCLCRRNPTAATSSPSPRATVER